MGVNGSVVTLFLHGSGLAYPESRQWAYTLFGQSLVLLLVRFLLLLRCALCFAAWREGKQQVDMASLSHNIKRTKIRKKSYLHRNLRSSLQHLSGEETLVKLNSAIERFSKDNKLRGMRQVLIELLQCGCLEFDFGYELFCCFFESTPARQFFRDTLIDETYGIPVLIYRCKSGRQLIVLNDGSVAMKDIFLHLIEGDEEQQHEQYGDEVTAELVHRAIDSMVNEYDRTVTKALLSISAGKTDTWFGMTSSRAAKLLKSLEQRLEAWEACKSEAEDLVVQRLAERINGLQSRVDAATEKLQVVIGRWPPQRVGDLENERSFLQESLERVKQLQVNKYEAVITITC